MKQATHSPLFVTKDLFETRYKGADVIFVAGSVGRGEATAHSDLDLVIVYPKVQAAYRESFQHMGWPVEAFIHDTETLRYFFDQVAGEQGRATLAEMIVEGHEAPAPTAMSAELKRIAEEVLRRGPPVLDEADVQDRRYVISELIDDIRAPRSRQEMLAAGAAVYQELADYYFRINRGWSGSGKAILKRMKKVDPGFARKFSDAFDDLFINGQQKKVIDLAEELLQSSGGFLFEGYRRDVPSSWRSR